MNVSGLVGERLVPEPSVCLLVDWAGLWLGLVPTWQVLSFRSSVVKGTLSSLEDLAGPCLVNLEVIFGGCGLRVARLFVLDFTSRPSESSSAVVVESLLVFLGYAGGSEGILPTRISWLALLKYSATEQYASYIGCWVLGVGC